MQVLSTRHAAREGEARLLRGRGVAEDGDAHESSLPREDAGRLAHVHRLRLLGCVRGRGLIV